MDHVDVFFYEAVSFVGESPVVTECVCRVNNKFPDTNRHEISNLLLVCCCTGGSLLIFQRYSNLPCENRSGRTSSTVAQLKSF